MANCVCVKIVIGPSCLRRNSGAVRQCAGCLQSHQRQRHQFQQPVNPGTAATTWVQSSVRDAWTSAGVRTRRAVQQDMQRHAVSRDTTAWSSVAPGHPLAVWALREVPNATTGVSPNMLVYGRLPRGPQTSLVVEHYHGATHHCGPQCSA